MLTMYPGYVPKQNAHSTRTQSILAGIQSKVNNTKWFADFYRVRAACSDHMRLSKI